MWIYMKQLTQKTEERIRILTTALNNPNHTLINNSKLRVIFRFEINNEHTMVHYNPMVKQTNKILLSFYFSKLYSIECIMGEPKFISYWMTVLILFRCDTINL